MTTNRAEILLNVRSTLAAIAIGGGPAPGYFTTIVTVTGKGQSYDKFAATELPAACVFPAKRVSAPAYSPFANIEDYIDIEIWAHVRSAMNDDDDKARRIGELGEDIRRALQVDTRRGGWAVDTTLIEGIDTDEGTEDDSSKDFGSTSLRLVFRCTFYPND